jgi:hypothetical protein
LIGYVGIGEFKYRTPGDWIMDLAEKVPLGRLPLFDALTHIGTAAEEELKRFPPSFDRRHTFYVGAFVNGQTVAAFVSNFQNVQTGTKLSLPTETFEVSWRFPLRPVIVIVGADEAVTDADCDDVLKLVREEKSEPA